MSEQEPITCNPMAAVFAHFATLERQLAEAQRLLRAASGWMPESNVPPAWNEPILKWREDVARILGEKK